MLNLAGAGSVGQAIIKRDTAVLSPSYAPEYALVVDRAEETGRHVMDALIEMQGRHPSLGDVRGRGLMVGVAHPLRHKFHSYDPTAQYSAQFGRRRAAPF